MEPITYIDRLTGFKEIEKVYGHSALKLLYGDGALGKTIGRPLSYLCARNPLSSSLYGWWQKQSWTKRNIKPFIDQFDVDASEFLNPIDQFSSFNDFFIRKLKPSARPIVSGEDVAIIPADGRYLFFSNIETSDGFFVKGKKFNLSTLLQDEDLAGQYHQGSMLMARLCPSDYHRFHFPCASIPNESHLINGWLYSVNPVAVKRNINIFTQNKRTLTVLERTPFGKILYLEIGATNVGSIIQTYSPNHHQSKGTEKGYFSFGASSLIILFPPNSIKFDDDLLDATRQGLEIRCLMGQSMGKRIQSYFI